MFSTMPLNYDDGKRKVLLSYNKTASYTKFNTASRVSLIYSSCLMYRDSHKYLKCIVKMMDEGYQHIRFMSNPFECFANFVTQLLKGLAANIG